LNKLSARRKNPAPARTVNASRSALTSGSIEWLLGAELFRKLRVPPSRPNL
jgi:hypothetical protein